MVNDLMASTFLDHAIVKKIGERLRASLKEDRELPKNLREQIERLRQSEEAGAGERW